MTYTYCRIASGLIRTSAKWNVIMNETFGVSSARMTIRWYVARIGASIINASSCIWAIKIREAVSRLFATRFERISDQTMRTDASVRAFRVLTTMKNIVIFLSQTRLKSKMKNIWNGEVTYTAEEWQGFFKHSSMSTQMSPASSKPG